MLPPASDVPAAAAPKPLSRREQKLQALLAESVANEAAASGRVPEGAKKVAAPKKAEKTEKAAGAKRSRSEGNEKEGAVAAAGRPPAAGRHAAEAPAAKHSAANANASKRPQGSKPAGGDAQYTPRDIDFCGKGHPFDRLQFGYSPSENDEARAFHSTIPTNAWIRLRKENYKKSIIKREKLARPNCEPLTQMFKLKRYWAQQSGEHAPNMFDGGFAEGLLEQLVSRQAAPLA